jgi:hypothetical protein
VDNLTFCYEMKPERRRNNYVYTALPRAGFTATIWRIKNERDVSD